MTKGSRLDPAWEPNNLDRDFAESLGLAWEDTAAEFRDYWLAKPGAAATKVDWPATWRNWCRNSKKAKPVAGERNLLSQDNVDSQRRMAAMILVRQHPGVFNPDAERVAKALTGNRNIDPCRRPNCRHCAKIRTFEPMPKEQRERVLGSLRKLLVETAPIDPWGEP